MRLLLSCVLLVSVACSRGAPETSNATSKPKPTAVKASRTVEYIYDAEGRLKPSDERVAWLVLPMGLERTSMTRARHHVYKSNLPMKALTAYFDHVVLTGQIELLGKSVAYRAAGPKSMQKDAPALDIVISPVPGSQDELAVRVDERTVIGVAPLSDQQARSVLAQETKRAE